MLLRQWPTVFEFRTSIFPTLERLASFAPFTLVL